MNPGEPQHNWTRIKQTSTLQGPTRSFTPQPEMHIQPGPVETAISPNQLNMRSFGYYNLLMKIFFFCLLADLVLMTFIEWAVGDIYLLVGLCIAQVILIVVNLLLLLIAFTNTQPFHAGLLRLLVSCPSISGCCQCFFACCCGSSDPTPSAALRNNNNSCRSILRQCLWPFCGNRRSTAGDGEFNSAVYATLLYLLFCSGMRVWELISLWDCADQCDLWSNTAFRILYIFLRLDSISYYFFFKRAIFAICDVRYYQRNSPWLKERMKHFK